MALIKYWQSKQAAVGAYTEYYVGYIECNCKTAYD